MKDWFHNWFDSPYYPLLYNKRNEEEADLFLNNLYKELNFSAATLIWDNACGSGRHCRSLAKLGLKVTGTDLSPNSIQTAINSGCANTEFYIHDMRNLFRTSYFDCVLNLFTSIGYFEKYSDNHKVFDTVYKSLKPGGFFVIDFFNSTKVKNQLVAEQTEHREGIDFYISKNISSNSINKSIKFEVNGKMQQFQEKVTLFNLNDLTELAHENGFSLCKTFGNYLLEPFNEQESDRLILILQKK